MVFSQWLIILSAIISVMGSTAYIRDTIAGRSKPNRISYSMWAIAPLIGAMAALSAQADVWTTIRIFLAGLLPLLVLIASLINPKSYWKITRFDIACGVCGLFALLAWGLVDSPRTAILLAAVGDGFATIPTLLKAWKYPETETGLAYVASFMSVLLVIPSISRWDIENSAFQIYLFISNGLLMLVVYRKRIAVFSRLTHRSPL